LRQAWSLEDLVVTEGDRLTEVDFNITARNLPYSLPIDESGDVLDEITFSFHIDVALEDTTVDVPVYSFTVSQSGEIVAFEKRTQTVSGVTVNGTFKYDHYIEGWDWADENSRLALATHVFAGNYVPPAVARILHLEFALRGLERGLGTDREHRDGTVGDRPLLVEGDTMLFEDEWARIGRLTWVSDVWVDGVQMRMLFQLFRAERIMMGGLRAGGGIFGGIVFGGAFIYPQGEVIFHDPTLSASVFVPGTAEGGPFAALAPYFIQLGVVTAAIVGLVAYQVLRRKPQA
ncbi:MAG: hypothetical protein R3291_03750, partial [Thermoplasmata archaeon]|nr:hypothetical protein [Thermoplasmata archaeon]